MNTKEIENRIRDTFKSKEFELSSDTQQTIRNRLVVLSQDKSPQSFSRTWWKPLLLTGFLSIFLVLPISVLALADSAIPGDTLYGIDRLGEQIALSMATSESSRRELLERFAQERYQEYLEIQNRYQNRINIARQELENAIEKLDDFQEGGEKLGDKFRHRFDIDDDTSQPADLDTVSEPSTTKPDIPKNSQTGSGNVQGETDEGSQENGQSGSDNSQNNKQP